jgi:hypothetical protein
LAKAGLSKAQAGQRIDALRIHLASTGTTLVDGTYRSLKNRALGAAGYEKDAKKAAARKGKGKILTAVDRVIACARHHAKGDPAVLKLLKAAIASIEAAE